MFEKLKEKLGGFKKIIGSTIEEKGKEAAKAPAGKATAGKPAVKGKEPEKKEEKKPGKK